MANPKLPQELEREIFEIAFSNHQASPTHMLLVARRVCEWIEPLVYRSLYIKPDPDADSHCDVVENLYSNIKSKPKSFLRKNVRTVTILLPSACGYVFHGRPNVDDLLELLVTSCPFITEFTLWDDTGPHTHVSDKVMELIACLPLKRLQINNSVHQAQFLRHVRLSDGQTNCCSHLTHLNLTGHRLQLSQLAYFPEVKYLLFSIPRNFFETAIEEVIESFLSRRTARSLVLTLDGFGQGMSSSLKELEMNDPRVVVYQRISWEDLSFGRSTGFYHFWEGQEAIISRRLLFM